MDLKNKVAVVTGSSSGIGEAIALELSKEGARVVVNSRRNSKGGEGVVSRIKVNGGDAFYFQADLSKPDEVKKFFTEVTSKYEFADILVNCAGESTPGELEDLDVWKYQFETTLLTALLSTSEFLSAKANKKLRKIVNISSIYGSPLGGNTDYLAYSAFKASLNNITVNLAKKLSPEVLVNAVSPGFTRTPAWGELTDELREDMRRETKIGRFVEPVEIAQAVLMVLKNDAITGQVITVDGGSLLKDLY